MKHSAFMPRGDGKTSVFRILGLSEEDIWKLGRDFVEHPGRSIHARADVTVEVVTSCGLIVDPDNDPPRHANIVGWSDEKSKNQLMAMKLASRASLVVKS